MMAGLRQKAGDWMPIRWNWSAWCAANEAAEIPAVGGAQDGARVGGGLQLIGLLHRRDELGGDEILVFRVVQELLLAQVSAGFRVARIDEDRDQRLDLFLGDQVVEDGLHAPELQVSPAHR